MTPLAEVESLLHRYQVWLKDRTALRELDANWVEITTPYLDRHNDALQIFARRDNGRFLLSDDSYTIHDLAASGCNLETDKRKELLRTTLAGFGVQLSGEALEVHASPEDFPQRKHSLVQAMLAVNDLFYLAQPFIESLFHEDVVAWLDDSDIRYTPNAQFKGISGYDHLFDFVIPKSRKQPERILRAINLPTRDTALTFINAWTDTQVARSPESRAYAVLNDRDKPVSANVLDAFRSYKIHPIVWSQRTDVTAELAA
jgi:hypothetical protein